MNVCFPKLMIRISLSLSLGPNNVLLHDSHFNNTIQPLCCRLMYKTQAFSTMCKKWAKKLCKWGQVLGRYSRLVTLLSWARTIQFVKQYTILHKQISYNPNLTTIAVGAPTCPVSEPSLSSWAYIEIVMTYFHEQYQHLYSNIFLAFPSVNLLTLWLMKPGGSMTHSQGLSNNPYPEQNQLNPSYWNLFL